VTLFDVAAESPTPRAPLSRVRLVVAYDGGGFHGFARNPGVRTVAGLLTDVLEKILRHRVELTCAGRTDKGVHAWGQVVTFDASAAHLDLAALARSVNALCGPAVVVRDAAVVPADFDARFSADSRLYRYRIVNRPEADPFLAGRAWHVPDPLDVRDMELAGDPLIGEHDFSSFCRRPKPGPDGGDVSLRRRVLSVAWHDEGDGLLRFEIEATAFCHQMVRSIVGSLVDTGLGRRRAGVMKAVLEARDRSAAGAVAPPDGLYLWAVRYAGWSSDRP
jgi:tRNA pseudouridine38-40 synthase